MPTPGLDSLKLNRFFGDVLASKQTLRTGANGKLFLNALCAQSDPATALSRISNSQAGLTVLTTALRLKLSTEFFNNEATKLLKYIQAPELGCIDSGEFLKTIVIAIVEPPIFWHGFLRAYRECQLNADAERCFGWLLLQLIDHPLDQAETYKDTARDPSIQDRLLKSSDFATRAIAARIQHILSSDVSVTLNDDEFGPGGRHDNDKVNYRDISILPTADELTSTERPFLRAAAALEDPETEDNRLGIHLDNQFRLLREDMLGEIREELHIALGKRKGRHRGTVLNGLIVSGVDCGTEKRREPWSLRLDFLEGVPALKKKSSKDRKKYLTDRKNFLRHQSVACLLVDDEVVAFPTINRNEDQLARDKPSVMLRLTGEPSTTKALLKLKTGARARLVQIDTAVFSYEPILRRLQGMKELELREEILHWKPGAEMKTHPLPLAKLSRLVAEPSIDLKQLGLKLPKSVILDEAQSSSLLMGLTHRVSLIQGPPGTGKSFLGALLVKILHDSTSKKILVISYTNHALDQMLNDLIKIGIPDTSLVRLGGKGDPSTQHLSLFNQQLNSYKIGQETWKAINKLRDEAKHHEETLRESIMDFMGSTIPREQLMEHLVFPPNDEFFEAFEVPEQEDGMRQVGKGGRAISAHYLLEQWLAGKDAGVFRGSVAPEHAHIWQIPREKRYEQHGRWQEEILKHKVESIYTVVEAFNENVRQLDNKFREKNEALLKEKRIIGCTTTGAAKYFQEVLAASPDVLMVEEAGEILESHVLTALNPKAEQLIMIGDHKQLRPKVSNYKLTVENGGGYDLNRSMFERLILKGYPHETLTAQHRMRPEISDLVRQLTYPGLVDAPKTKGRLNIRGFRDNVVFFSHNKPEEENEKLSSMQSDTRLPSSKQNRFEADMCLKCVRYLGQNGYGTDKIVVLTPYLAQLHLLREVLSKENDPILNDLDSYDLVRAGLLPAASARLIRKPIRISSIDNFQGDESEIVIASMTRSNASHDIGFMASPERLNVLLSRARDGLIMVGNADTYRYSRNGKALYGRFFELLIKGGHVYDFFPLRCHRHPDRAAEIRRPIEFDEQCPDGGCTAPCGTKLNCGRHTCSQRCHQLADHSKVKCVVVERGKCPAGIHDQSWICSAGIPLNCHKCDREAKIQKDKKQRDFILQEKKEAEIREHQRQMALLDEQIEVERQKARDNRARHERAKALEQRQKDLEDATAGTAQKPSSQPATAFQGNHRSTNPPLPTTINANAGGTPPVAQAGSAPPKKGGGPQRITANEQDDSIASAGGPPNVDQDTPPPLDESASKKDWQRQKDTDNASNSAIDELMEMVGLERVKRQVLEIKAKIDLSLRQGTDLKDERFGIALLGNPGTGKTTVARLYAKFLTSVDLIPGNDFVETTGSRLANDGVPGAKKLLEGILNNGGGAFFIDESYQLTEKQSFGGGQVLDFLLAEIENNVGKIVFIFAGYNKNMETFFEHNPGIPSRIPYQLQFDDYSDKELHLMLFKLIDKKYKGRMKVEGGLGGLYMRIAVRRLGRGREKEGFGNCRSLQLLAAKIYERQATRIKRERANGIIPDDFLLTREDLIGPEPSNALKNSSPWKKLQALIGLDSVKESVQMLFDTIGINYQRELAEKAPIEVSLNRVFLGPPGTGKTSVAKLYGKILAELGLLSNGEVVAKNPADFVGSALGQSEANTKAILANTVGKVLVIDEAYMLYSGNNGSGNVSDPYKAGVIDTIVAEIHSVPGDDRCVLLLGYEDQMREMFRNVNPGLSRRFSIEEAFRFDNFTSEELRRILDLKLKDQELGATGKAKDVAMEVLGRMRRRPNFGNAGDVENLLGKAKSQYQARQATKSPGDRPFDIVFEPEDFDREYDRGTRAEMNCKELFKDIIGSNDVVEKLEGYQAAAAAAKEGGFDPFEEIPTNFLFKGPPGTGKTTTARKMGRIFYDMGFLSSDEVVEISATDLIGQFVGQTGPKTQQQLEKGLGKVLFIDEAYRLADGHFAQEAIDQLVDLLTKERFANKLIVILAGYERDINRLVAANSGLSSRFPEEIFFHNMSPEHCLQLLAKELEKKNFVPPALSGEDPKAYEEMRGLIGRLAALSGWGNGRDIKTLAKNMIRCTFQAKRLKSQSGLASEKAIEVIRDMLRERQERANQGGPKQENPSPVQVAQPPLHSIVKTETSSTVKKAEEPPPDKEKLSGLEQQESRNAGRDPGVSDQVWSQLLADKRANDEKERRKQEELRRVEEEAEKLKEQEKAEAAALEKLRQDKLKEKEEAELQELKRREEEARQRELKARIARQRELERLEKLRKEEEARRKKEAAAQKKLRDMGVCLAGFRWIKSVGGYRCAGGTHFITDAQLGV